jgi:CHAT domain-containing protein
VVVVPDGALHLIPFEALEVGGNGSRAPRYWLDDGPPLRYASSATSLVALERRQRQAPAGALALSVSDPQTSMSRWAPLPGTRLETRAIVAALGAGVDTLTGATATERAVRAALPGRRIVHLATHGFVTEGRGDVLGGIVLAAPDTADLRSGAAGADGLLQLFEIYGLHLDCDLAVLSACETAAGARVAGEGVFALARGFLTAGAERVIASLWSVNDASTAALMSALFRSAPDVMRRGQEPDWAAALHQAKRVVRANPETAAPFYWAPFVLAGVR